MSPPQHQPQVNVEENVFSERELEKALRDILTRAAWYGFLPLLNANSFERGSSCQRFRGLSKQDCERDRYKFGIITFRV